VYCGCFIQSILLYGRELCTTNKQHERFPVATLDVTFVVKK
jgi:hypothetical protein